LVTKQEQHEQRRLQLLQVALEQFVARGFYGTSTREISKAAGISSGLMFHYFNSKEHIYEELIKIGCQRMDIDFTSGMTDPAAFLHALVSELLAMLEYPFSAKMFVLMGNAFFHRDISQKVNDMLDVRNVSLLSKELIMEGQRLGQFKEGDPVALSLAFWNAIQGIAGHIALRPDDPMPEAAWIMAILIKS
jgi:AcrR family transcriptional regulator